MYINKITNTINIYINIYVSMNIMLYISIKNIFKSFFWMVDIGINGYWSWVVFISICLWASNHRRSWHGLTTTFFLTFCLQIYFQSNFFISLLFHLFFLILTCSCQYSYNLMLTSNCMCRPYIVTNNPHTACVDPI